MALSANTPRETEAQITKRFGIAQDGAPSAEQLELQASLRETFAGLGVRINRDIADGREKSLAQTHLEEALMWAGKAIFA